MVRSDDHRITRLLEEISSGDERAADELLPLVYGELRSLARARMAKESPGHTLQPTALVHEAYLRLVGDEDVRWQNRGHFFAAAAEAMRRILVEWARAKARIKRGGDLHRTPFDEDFLGRQPEIDQILAIDVALDRLESRDVEMTNVVKLRYFAGLTVEETAQAMQVSPRTVNRLWTGARAWLHREMARPTGG
jgi:RNA polymerase sigma factor (TIGR02999 family)